MALPNVNISFANGALGTVSPPADGVSAMLIKFDTVATAVPVALFRSYAEVKAASGFPTDDSDTGMKEVKEFFDRGGTKLYLRGLASTATHSTIDTALMDELYNASNGEIRLIGVMLTVTAVAEITTAYVNAMQAAADYMRNTYRAPVQFIIASSGTVNAAISVATPAPDVSVVAGQTNPNTTKFISSIGAILGRLAASAVQVHPGKVSDGAIADSAYGVHVSAALTNSQAATLHDNGYITYRQFAGKAGYYVSDDPTLTPSTDDYHSLARRRTVNKAFRIANEVLTEKINSEVPTQDDGNGNGVILPDYAATIEAEVEQAIRRNMTAYGNLSSVNDDGGVQCEIDKEWNVMGTSTLKVTLQVRPFGYAKFIDVSLGFML